jgi:membrane protease YdiL (CAAX protease family)
MSVEKYRHPVLFYGLSTAIPWTLWFIAAYLSHVTPGSDLLTITRSILGVIGLAGPALIAFLMIFPDPGLRKDLLGRLFNFKAVRPVYIFLTCFLMLASILLAQAVSLLFGHSAVQFRLRGGFSFTAGIFPAWFLLLLAPLLEELAWHSYGTDCLRARLNLFATSMIFGLYWGLWHFPLSFIKGYYHSNLAATGLIYSLNFFVSLIPYVILMNWLYYKTARNVSVAIVFHITAGFFNEIFATHPDSKVIQTGLLLALSVFIVLRDKDFFFRRDNQESGGVLRHPNEDAFRLREKNVT